MAQPATENKQRIFFPALTGLRAVAALMVFAHHYFAHHPKMPLVLDMFVSKMFIGLTLFFVLTGFLIAFRYFPHARLSVDFLKKYYQNRLVRVYPLYLILTVIILVWQNVSNWKIWVLNLTMSKALFSEYKFTGLAQAWSLTVIEMFYLFAPLLQLWVKSKRSVWWLLIPAYAVGFFLVWVSDLFGLGSFFANNNFMLIFTVFGHAFTFLFGMWCMGKLHHVRNWVAKYPGWLTYASVVGFVLCIYGWSFMGLHDKYYWAHEPGGIIFTNVILAFFCGGIILGLVSENTYISRLLSWKPVLQLGKSSYAFYLLNMGFFAHLIYEYIGHNPFAVLLITGIASIFIHEYFERPLMKRFGGERTLKK